MGSFTPSTRSSKRPMPGKNQADPDSPVTLRQLMMRVSHPKAAETALATVNTEAGLDYWLPCDPHQELQRMRHGNS